MTGSKLVSDIKWFGLMGKVSITNSVLYVTLQRSIDDLTECIPMMMVRADYRGKNLKSIISTSGRSIIDYHVLIVTIMCIACMSYLIMCYFKSNLSRFDTLFEREYSYNATVV